MMHRLPWNQDDIAIIDQNKIFVNVPKIHVFQAGQVLKWDFKEMIDQQILDLNTLK